MRSAPAMMISGNVGKRESGKSEGESSELIHSENGSKPSTTQRASQIAPEKVSASRESVSAPLRYAPLGNGALLHTKPLQLSNGLNHTKRSR